MPKSQEKKTIPSFERNGVSAAYYPHKTVKS